MNSIVVGFAVIVLVLVLLAVPNMPSSWDNSQLTMLIYFFIFICFGSVLYYTWGDRY